MEEFAKSISIKNVYDRFYDIKDNNDHSFNTAYSHTIRNYMFDYRDFKPTLTLTTTAKEHREFRQIFIPQIIENVSSDECVEFSNQFKFYNGEFKEHNINANEMMELWKEFSKVKDCTTKVLNDPEHQQLISAFKTNETGDLFTDLNDIYKTTLKMYLRGDREESPLLYRVYLMTCIEKNGKYIPDTKKCKKAFHKFNVWLDQFYKKHKKTHRIPDGEKMFYLYLL